MNYLHNKWGGLVVKELNSILGVQGSNFTYDIHYGEHLNIPYLLRLLMLGGYLNKLKQSR